MILNIFSVNIIRVYFIVRIFPSIFSIDENKEELINNNLDQISPFHNTTCPIRYEINLSTRHCHHSLPSPNSVPEQWGEFVGKERLQIGLSYNCFNDCNSVLCGSLLLTFGNTDPGKRDRFLHFITPPVNQVTWQCDVITDFCHLVTLWCYSWFLILVWL